MKRIRLFLILLIIYLIQTGCFLKSVHPLVEEENSILVEGLEGIWETEDQRWTFVNDATKFPNLAQYLGEDIEVDMEEDDDLGLGNVYLIFFENLQDLSADTAMFMGMVTELNDAYFLDLSVFAKSISDLDESESNFVDNHFFPVHTFSKIKLEEGQLDIEFFQSSFISDLISSNRIRIKHEDTDDSILITASTAELRKFVEKYAHDEDAFEDAMEFTFKGFEYVQ
jgi:hypothetical protein